MGRSFYEKIQGWDIPGSMGVRTEFVAPHKACRRQRFPLTQNDGDSLQRATELSRRRFLGKRASGTLLEVQ